MNQYIEKNRKYLRIFKGYTMACEIADDFLMDKSSPSKFSRGCASMWWR